MKDFNMHTGEQCAHQHRKPRYQAEESPEMVIILGWLDAAHSMPATLVPKASILSCDGLGVQQRHHKHKPLLSALQPSPIPAQGTGK